MQKFPSLSFQHPLRRCALLPISISTSKILFPRLQISSPLSNRLNLKVPTQILDPSGPNSRKLRPPSNEVIRRIITRFSACIYLVLGNKLCLTLTFRYSKRLLRGRHQKGIPPGNSETPSRQGHYPLVSSSIMHTHLTMCL